MKNIKKYLIIGVFLGVLVIPNLTSATTIQELQAQITALLQQVKLLQDQLKTIQQGGVVLVTPSLSTTTPNFTYNLYFGLNDSETGGEITKLQKYLAQDQTIYPEGLITGFYGPLTEAAVKRWQCKYGIVCKGSLETTGYGAFGPQSRVKLKEIYAMALPSTPTPTPTPNVVVVGVTNPYPLDGNYSVRYPIENLILQWNNNLSQYSPSCAPASSYDLYLSHLSDPTKSTIFNANLKGEKYIDIINYIDVSEALEYNQVYYWRVDVHDACGNVLWGPVWSFITAGPPVPLQPSNLNAQILQSGSVKLTWNDNSNNEDGFKIERKEEGGSYKFIAAVNLAEFTDTGLADGVKYYYRVKAYNISGDSGYSNEFSITKSISSQLSLKISKSPNSPSGEESVVAGSQQIPFAIYDFDTNGSSGDIKIFSVKLGYSVSLAGKTNDLINCILYDNSNKLTTGVNIVNPYYQDSYTFNFDSPLTIPKSSTKIISLKCNVGPSAISSYSWSFTEPPSATGLSGIVAQVNMGAMYSNINVVSHGELPISLDASTPSVSRTVAAGSTNVVATVIRLGALNEDITLQSITLQFRQFSGANVYAVKKFTVWNEAINLGEGNFSPSNYTSVVKLSQPIVIPKNGFTNPLSIKVDLANIGEGLIPVKAGDMVSIDYVADGAKGVGQISGTIINSKMGASPPNTGIKIITLSE